jgi:hypothetical protein
MPTLYSDCRGVAVPHQRSAFTLTVHGGVPKGINTTTTTTTTTTQGTHQSDLDNIGRSF